MIKIIIIPVTETLFSKPFTFPVRCSPSYEYITSFHSIHWLQGRNLIVYKRNKQITSTDFSKLTKTKRRN